jgi:probable F420-dependent oxidoreductase
MKLGICVPHYGRPIEVERMLAVVRYAEEVGLDSVWVTDHVIVPQDVDVIYREHMLDPLAVLPWLAAATERVSLGTSVVILPYRTPIPVAKLLASVDVLSGGRLIVGVAIGWMEGEFAALGVPFKERVSRSEEALELFRSLWTTAEPELETRRHRLRGVRFSPLTLQKPRPPLLVGGNSEGALRRAARLGDGWHATSTNQDAFRQAVQTLTKFWTEAKRDGSPALTLRIPIVIDGIHRPAVDMGLLGGRYVVRGSVKNVLEELRGFQAHGCEHIALEVSYSTFPAILETIDVLAAEVKPRLAQ